MVSFEPSLLGKVYNFRSGKFEKHDKRWRKLTSDPNILSIAFSHKTELADKATSPKYSDEEINLIKDEIDKLLSKGIYYWDTCHEEKEFVSPIFLSYRGNEGISLIVNMRKLNKIIQYHHF